MSAYETINNYQVVIDTFGQWPIFHDGEVLRVVLDRTRRHPSGSCSPSIELHIRGWIMTSEVSESGFYKLEHDSVVHFLFDGVTDVELDGFNHQNVLSSLDFEIMKDNESGLPLLAVELGDCFGLSGSFKAIQASVVSVVPYVPPA
jgi:hypothetical protein